MFLIGAVPILIVFIIVIAIIMENQNNLAGLVHTSAKDFFLHLGAIVGLYTIVISFLNLIFKVVNNAFPEVSSNYYAWGGGSDISMPVATLIVVFPIFILISYFVQRIYSETPEKKELAIRKWLTYITLFVTGIILVADLVTVLYKFLDGQDLTAAFLLKALAVLAVAGFVFGFYLQDIRDRISSRHRKTFIIASGAIILASIIVGFGILGSPKTQRLIRYDNQKITDLQNMYWQVVNYWQVYGSVPNALSENVPIDPQTEQKYEYRKTGEMTFELCATFNREFSYRQSDRYNMSMAPYPTKFPVSQNDNWDHGAGRQCFQRMIDPIAYPTQVRG